MPRRKSSFRYGFKTEATDLAREVRAELGLTTFDRLDPWALSAHLDIPVIPLSDFVQVAPSVKHLLDIEKEAFSAATVFCGLERTIVHNDGHALVRQHSNVAHELAHGLLLHTAKPALNAHGCRDWDQAIEDEAQWLAGELLVTKEAAMQVALGRSTAVDAAQHLGVSLVMLRYRVRMSGAETIVKRAAARQAR